DYHVLLGTPFVAPTVTLKISSGQGNAYRDPKYYIGVVRQSLFSSMVNGMAAQYPPNQRVVVLSDALDMSTTGTLDNCCVWGSHAGLLVKPANATTWIYASSVEPGFFADGAGDVTTLSHEVAEWLNDPFTTASDTNFIPPAVLPGQDACITTSEIG